MKRISKYLVLFLIIISVFLIYVFFKNDKINYIAIGDSLAKGVNAYNDSGYSYNDYLKDYLDETNKISYYTKKYTKKRNTTAELIKELETNTKMKKDLRESDLVTISIGGEDILNNIKIEELNINEILSIKKEISNILIDIENCIKEIRKYAKKEIIVIGYYNPIPFLFNVSGNDIDKLFAYIDEEYKKISKKYNCIYIPIYQLFKNNSNFLPNPSSIYPGRDGYEAIFNEIIKNYKIK